MSTRTPSEIEILKKEAERRVRTGENRIDIARDLGVPPSTLGGWATDGMWRRKDLAFELDEERGRAALARIAEAAAAKVEASQKRAARVKELADAAFAAMQAADPGGEGNPPGMAHVPTHHLSMQLAHDLVLQGRLDEAERAARFALRFAQARKVTRDEEGERWRKDRHQIMEWWRNHREGFDTLYKEAAEMTAELESQRQFQQDMHHYECCPTCIRPMEFWPARMDEKIGRICTDMEMKDA